MSGSEGIVQAVGFAHPPVPKGLKVLKRHAFAQIEWHREKCPAPMGNCTGCASAPKANA